MKKVIVVGCGAAGMMAAVAAAEAGHQVRIYEKNEKAGKKLFITGKGRCNVTNACDTEDLFQHIVHNPKFLYSGFYHFTNFDMMDFLSRNHCPVKTERGERVFPVSDKSSDVIHALLTRLKKLQVEICLNEEVAGLAIENRCIRGIILQKGAKQVNADAVIVATGGLSYPSTGSTGDGYRFAKAAGHMVTELMPALVPLQAEESEIRELMGLSLRNVRVKIFRDNRLLYDEFGEMLFTHFGVSGPVILSASSLIASQIRKSRLTLSIDCKPALSEEQLDARILRDFEEVKNRQFKNSMSHLLPSKLIPVMVDRSGIDPDKKVNEISREERRRLAQTIKDFRMTLTGLRGYAEAIVTQGGVSVREINPSTMESKLVNNLYFAGEVLDLDAVTGGFNLQIAWSTGHLAGSSIG
ncbi:MAG: NAD(P)/FAD-dependent oxidoreductase [Clostridiales bacterium]|nr:NAD(P)/FAD-dependent oxidoreductase [Clostridiales bacterium]